MFLAEMAGGYFLRMAESDDTKATLNNPAFLRKLSANVLINFPCFARFG